MRRSSPPAPPSVSDTADDVVLFKQQGVGHAGGPKSAIRPPGGPKTLTPFSPAFKPSGVLIKGGQQAGDEKVDDLMAAGFAKLSVTSPTAPLGQETPQANGKQPTTSYALLTPSLSSTVTSTSASHSDSAVHTPHSRSSSQDSAGKDSDSEPIVTRGHNPFGPVWPTAQHLMGAAPGQLPHPYVLPQPAMQNMHGLFGASNSFSSAQQQMQAQQQAVQQQAVAAQQAAQQQVAYNAGQLQQGYTFPPNQASLEYADPRMSQHQQPLQQYPYYNVTPQVQMQAPTFPQQQQMQVQAQTSVFPSQAQMQAQMQGLAPSIPQPSAQWMESAMEVFHRLQRDNPAAQPSALDQNPDQLRAALAFVATTPLHPAFNPYGAYGHPSAPYHPQAPPLTPIQAAQLAQIVNQLIAPPTNPVAPLAGGPPPGATTGLAQALGGNASSAAGILTIPGGAGIAGPCSNNRKANLYKTELCRNYEEKGQCRYGAKCQFAHGREELREINRHPKYKTEFCRTFWRDGSCPYAGRCCFIHPTDTKAIAAYKDLVGSFPNLPGMVEVEEAAPRSARPEGTSNKRASILDRIREKSPGTTVKGTTPATPTTPTAPVANGNAESGSAKGSSTKGAGSEKSSTHSPSPPNIAGLRLDTHVPGAAGPQTAPAARAHTSTASLLASPVKNRTLVPAMNGDASERTTPVQQTFPSVSTTNNTNNVERLPTPGRPVAHHARGASYSQAGDGPSERAPPPLRMPGIIPGPASASAASWASPYASGGASGKSHPNGQAFDQLVY